MRRSLNTFVWAVLGLLSVSPILAQQAAPPYVLSPDDQLAISVLGHADLTQSVTILPDGTIRYPIVGTVHAAGRTVDGLTQALTRGLADQLNQPLVTVSVVQSRPRQVSVLGAVKTPGLYAVTPGTHLLDILAACGGPLQDPALTQATLVLDGGRKSLTVDMTGLLAGTNPSQNLPMDPGDVLLVQARDPSAAQAQVLGEVAKPGAVPVPPDGLTVAAVLAQTGGATPEAALSRAQILHDGRAQTCDLRPLLHDLSDPVGQVRLLPGDVLLVPANQDRVAVLGEVHTPGVYRIPDGGSLAVTDALALAGGADSDSDSKDAAILRRSAAGPPVLIHVSLDALLHGDAKAANTELEPGDILYLPTRRPGSGFNAANLLSLVPLVNVVRW